MVKKLLNQSCHQKKGSTFEGWFFQNEKWIFSECVVVSDMTLVAHWKEINYNVRLLKNINSAGTVAGDGAYHCGNKVTLVATTNPGYNFIGWYKKDEETPLSSELEYLYTMTAENADIEAKWNYYTLTVSRNDTQAGTVNFDSEKVSIESEVKLVATTNPGYNFIGWYKKGEETPLSSELEYLYTMTAENADIEAKWNYYTVTFTCENVNISTLSNLTYINKKVSVGETVEIKCLPFLGYKFDGWYDMNDVEISSDANLSFVMIENNTEYIAKCVIDNDMSNYIFTSSLTKCTINAVIDSTVVNAIMPNYVTNVDSDVFKKCELLEGVYINDISKWCTIVFENRFSNPIYYAKKLYLNNNLVTKLVIPEDVTIINAYAFYNCSSIKSMIIGSSLKKIRQSAFGSVSAEGVYISDLAKWCTIDFENNFSNPSYGSDLYLNNELVVDLVIPDGITKISSHAFANCKSIKRVTIGPNITGIGSYAFDDCVELEGVYISDLEKWCTIDFYGIYSNPLYYAKKLYLNNELVVDLVIPESITSIYPMAFEGCTSIKRVTIGSSLKSIGSTAFHNCTSLEGVYISDLEKWFTIVFRDIYSNPLSWAKNLYLNNELVVDLMIPESVTSICQYAFMECTSIKKVTIGASLKVIETNAFNFCSGITEVHYKGTASDWTLISIASGNDSIKKATIIYD